MSRGVPRVFGIVACLCFALGASPAWAQESDDLLGESTVTVDSQPADQGDDGLLGEISQPDPVQTAPPPSDDSLLPREQDPDLDDDGVQNIDDVAPEDPNVGERPAPGPEDPIADDDNDGLPNLMDPDDSNDGVTDADEPRGEAPPAVAPPAESPAPGVPDPGTTAPAAGRSGPPTGQAAPLVLALPKAGDGAERKANHGTVLVIGSMLLLGASGVVRHQMRQD